MQIRIDHFDNELLILSRKDYPRGRFELEYQLLRRLKAVIRQYKEQVQIQEMFQGEILLLAFPFQFLLIQFGTLLLMTLGHRHSHVHIWAENTH